MSKGQNWRLQNKGKNFEECERNDEFGDKRPGGANAKYQFVNFTWIVE